MSTVANCLKRFNVNKELSELSDLMVYINQIQFFIHYKFHLSLYIHIYILWYAVEGDYCLTCGSDKSVKLWNPYRGALLKTYAGHGYEVLDAQSSCDSRSVFHSLKKLSNMFIISCKFLCISATLCPVEWTRPSFCGMLEVARPSGSFVAIWEQWTVWNSMKNPLLLSLAQWTLPSDVGTAVQRRQRHFKSCKRPRTVSVQFKWRITRFWLDHSTAKSDDTTSETVKWLPTKWPVSFLVISFLVSLIHEPFHRQNPSRLSGLHVMAKDC